MQNAYFWQTAKIPALVIHYLICKLFQLKGRRTLWCKGFLKKKQPYTVKRKPCAPLLAKLGLLRHVPLSQKSSFAKIGRFIRFLSELPGQRINRQQYGIFVRECFHQMGSCIFVEIKFWWSICSSLGNFWIMTGKGLLPSLRSRGQVSRFRKIQTAFDSPGNVNGKPTLLTFCRGPSITSNSTSITSNVATKVCFYDLSRLVLMDMTVVAYQTEAKSINRNLTWLRLFSAPY